MYGGDADLAVLLANSEDRAAGTDALTDVPSLVAMLEPFPVWRRRVTTADLEALRRARPRVREVFERSALDDPDGVVLLVNTLLRIASIRPHLRGPRGRPELMLLDPPASTASAFLSSAVLGIAAEVARLGTDRLGICAATGCRNAYLDRSARGRRRYCSPKCASRTHVAAHRERQRQPV